MDSAAADNQIKQMISFIVSEAEGKASEIQKKGDEEFSIEVHRIITQEKDRIRGTYERKTKQIETSYAINKSMAINKQRLEKIKARQAVMMKVQEDVKGALQQQLKQDALSKPFVTKLIVQGLLMLLESDVTIRCRQQDTQMISACLNDASSQYAKVIKDETGAVKACKLTIDTKEYLPDTCIGGVMLLCQNNKITIDNTIDLRLRLVMEQDKPAIRSLLFPAQ